MLSQQPAQCIFQLFKIFHIFLDKKQVPIIFYVFVLGSCEQDKKSGFPANFLLLFPDFFLCRKQVPYLLIVLMHTQQKECKLNETIVFYPVSGDNCFGWHDASWPYGRQTDRVLQRTG